MNKLKNNPIKIIVLSIVLTILLVLTENNVLADIGPAPVNPLGSSIDPGQGRITKVRMENEKVTIVIKENVRPVPSGSDDNPGFYMSGKVEATFWMRNLGNSNEQFDVWFPLSASSNPALMAYQPNNRIRDFKAWIDEKPVKGIEQVWGSGVGGNSTNIPWAKWNMKFKPGEEVIVKVTYTIYPGGRRPFADIEYILETGYGWYGTIGKATIEITLPYTIISDNVTFEGTYAPRPSGYQVEDNKVTWRFTELEPSPKHNIYLNALEPQKWQQLKNSRSKAKEKPNDALIQLKLARAASEAVLILKGVGNNGGGTRVADEATAAYRKALELDPENPKIYYEFATWLLANGGYSQLFYEGKCPQEVCDLVKTGLEKFPTDADLLKLNSTIQESIENAPIPLTDTPQPTHTPKPSATRAIPTETQKPPSPTKIPTLTATEAVPTKTLEASIPTEINLPTATSKPTTGGGGICKSVAGLVMIVGMVGWIINKRR
jgi:tetratricopeptide (TPR) repeat protein